MRRPRQADVFLLSYPKTGRTWLRVMIGQMLAAHFDHPELAHVELGTRMPRFEGVPRILAKRYRLASEFKCFCKQRHQSRGALRSTYEISPGITSNDTPFRMVILP